MHVCDRSCYLRGTDQPWCLRLVASKCFDSSLFFISIPELYHCFRRQKTVLDVILPYRDECCNIDTINSRKLSKSSIRH